MTRTVDLVVAGIGSDTLAPAESALRQGRRVLVLLQTGDARVARRLGRRLRRVAHEHGGMCTVERRVDLVCVDGIDGVEAVVFRHRRTGRLVAVNAAACVGRASASGDGVRASES